MEQTVVRENRNNKSRCQKDTGVYNRKNLAREGNYFQSYILMERRPGELILVWCTQEKQIHNVEEMLVILHLSV